ncbi:MAG TPA: dihydropyrimidinase [Candidatus Dormibacteraeota bacterium]|jgi:dihydropyrimidinase|nr:dihydropyrimidinase [Candidatus Dormibacteraeota bacterium]
MSHELVVRGGTVVTATDSVRADVGIHGGRVAELGPSLPPGRREIDAAGLLVLPGGVDVHTHLDAEVGGVRSVDDFESGTAAAACGGVTTICDYAWQGPGQSLLAAIEAWKEKAAGRSHVDYGFHVIVSDAGDATLAEIPRLVELGYPSLKVFMINEFGIGDDGLVRVLDAARKAGVVVNVHAENGDMLDHCTRTMLAAGRRDPRYYPQSRPVLAEAEATRRAIDYAALVDAEIYIVHLSCGDALEAVSAARRRGLRVWAETRPIYLALTEERYEVGGAEAAKFVGAPPLRTARDQAALWDGLRSGDIQAIGSDNTSWTVEQKAAGAEDFTKVPYGVPGLETEMPVIYSEGVSRGRIPIQTFVAAFSTNPARIFGLYPRKGTIAVGSDADLVLFDPTRGGTVDERRLHSRAGYDPFNGFRLRGMPVLTLSRGEVVARDGELVSRPGRGLHLARYRTATGS